MTPRYINNSNHKDMIRSKWVNCIKSNYPDQIRDGSISIITLPAEECQDIALFVSERILGWEDTETGAKKVTRGKVVCFERSTPIYLKIRAKLTGNSIVNTGEIGKYFQKNYSSIMNGQASIFPAEVINLDFDKNISKNDTDIEQIMDMVFQFQNKHRKNFSVFITFPQDESVADSDEFKLKLTTCIQSNLDDTANLTFKTNFEQKYEDIASMDYCSFLITGINKLFIRKAVNYNYTLTSPEYYSYGETGRHKMIAIILNFIFDDSVNTPSLYYRDIIKCLDTIEVIENQ